MVIWPDDISIKMKSAVQYTISSNCSPSYCQLNQIQHVYGRLKIIESFRKAIFRKLMTYFY